MPGVRNGAPVCLHRLCYALHGLQGQVNAFIVQDPDERDTNIVLRLVQDVESMVQRLAELKAERDSWTSQRAQKSK